MSRAFLVFIAFLSVACAMAVSAADGDHPLVGRYEGAQLVGHHASEYDEVALVSGPIVGDVASFADGWTKLEGRSELCYYRLPAERSSLEVLRNYEASLAAKGFARVFTCATSNGSCYLERPGHVTTTAPYDFGNSFDASPELPRLDGDFIRNYFGTNARHLLMRASRPEGAVWASVTIAEGTHGPHAFVRVVTAKAMDTGRIAFVDASAMGKAIASDGRVALYGILFDFDKDTLRPESKPTLDEIAKLLKSSPALKLVVAGHTDSQGGFDYNVDLSRRRAASVVAALASQYGITRDRLTAFGAGMAAPVASNEAEDGRAKNRRVELVAR